MTPKEVRQLWVKALRSGEYQQGTNCLITDDGKYCCLGVLTDLAVKNGIIPKFTGRGDGNNGTLVQEVLDWSGIQWDNGVYNEKNGSINGLAAQNDGGKTFSEIASIIEADPAGLCKI